MSIKFLAGDVIESPRDGEENAFLENMVKTFKKFSIEIIPTMIFEVEKDNAEKLEDTKYTVTLTIVHKEGQSISNILESYRSDNKKKPLTYNDLKTLFNYLVNFKRYTSN